jgi:hypothetical protein
MTELILGQYEVNQLDATVWDSVFRDTVESGYFTREGDNETRYKHSEEDVLFGILRDSESVTPFDGEETRLDFKNKTRTVYSGVGDQAEFMKRVTSK